MLEAELAEHLGYERNDPSGRGSGNSGNGTSPKIVTGDQGAMPLDVPRDRSGDFGPQVVPKGQRRLPGFDDKLISMYARGMTTREIQGHLEELYGIEVPPSLISRVTDAVTEEVSAHHLTDPKGTYTEILTDLL
jgi:putative transposase